MIELDTSNTQSTSTTADTGANTSSSVKILSVSVDHLLLRFNIRHNVVLVTEVLLSLLVLYTTDTFSYYGNNIDYTKWSCGAPRNPLTRAVCSNSTTNRTTFCRSLYEDPTFSFAWTYGKEASFSTEFGMYCNREDESQTILDITGIGAGIGALVGGIVGDLFGRKLNFKISFLIIYVSLVTLTFCQTVQILTLGLFLLGFSSYMSLTSIIVMVTEMLPHHLHYPLVITNAALTFLGVYLGCALRLLIYNSWRALAGCLLALNCILITLLFQLPQSPRYLVYQSADTDGAKSTLRKLNITLFEDEQIQVPRGVEEQLTFDYKTNKHFLITALVLVYLRGVVAMTTTPSAGQVWELVSDKNLQFTVIASFRVLALPIAGLLCYRNVNLKSTILVFGWVAVSSYFIGELPMGSGIFNVNNIAGVLLVPINRTLHIVIVLLTLQVTPTCYRATVFGLSIFVEKCFLKVGALISNIDYLPSNAALAASQPQQSLYLHEYSFLVFGVLFLSFIYAASYLPSNSFRVLPGTISEFNSMYWPRRTEQSYLLRRYSPKMEKESDTS